MKGFGEGPAAKRAAGPCNYLKYDWMDRSRRDVRRHQRGYIYRSIAVCCYY